MISCSLVSNVLGAMACKKSLQSNVNSTSLYWIYGEGEVENLYETIRKPPKPVAVYDEVFQNQLPSNVSMPSPFENTFRKDYKRRVCFGKWIVQYKRIAFFVKIVTIMLIIGIALKMGMQIDIYLFENENRSNIFSETTVTESTDNATKFLSEPTTVNETIESSSTVTPDYMSENWFINSKSQKYNCSVDFEIISTVHFQVVGRKCDSVNVCQEFLLKYQQSKTGNAIFAFYIDYIGNIYMGRSWMCPYTAGDMWVAVMVDHLDDMNPESEQVLQHFTNDVTTYGIDHSYLCECFNMNVLKSPM